MRILWAAVGMLVAMGLEAAPVLAQARTITVTAASDVRAGEPLDILVTVTGEKPAEVTVDPLGIGRDTFVERFWESSYRCVAGATCYSGFVRIDDRTRLGPRTLPLTLTDANGAQTHRTISFRVEPFQDNDRDGLSDPWEWLVGLDSQSAAGQNGASGDPDHDGVTNLDEFRADSFPRGNLRQYFAEASSGNRQRMSACFRLFEPEGRYGFARVRLYGDDGRVVTSYTGTPFGMACPLLISSYPADRVVAAVVETDIPMVVELEINQGPSGMPTHVSSPAPTPSAEWHFAAGADGDLYDLFYLTSTRSSDRAE